ncbi:MAG: amidohydrolase, partial [Verrucomicrobiota bacterium]
MKPTLSILILTFGLSLQAHAETADTIYHGGPILTIVDESPEAEAIAIKDGRILAVGTKEEVLQAKGDDTELIDLQGKTMLPGFVDSHGHAFMVGIQATTANMLPPPDGEGADIPSLQRLLNEWAEANRSAIERVGWIVGFGYDDSQLAEQRHPTKDDLDAVSTEVPVIIIHQSGHLGVGNSKALEVAGITADTEDPKGGVFRRIEGSEEPNGVAEEYAFFALLGALAARFDDEVNAVFAEEGAKLISTFGYTTAQEGRAMGEAVEALFDAGKSGKLKIDVAIYPDILATEEIAPSIEYENHVRVAGAKLTIDGSPQGKTALLREPYYVVPEGQKEDYAGYAAIDMATTQSAVEKAFANGWQIQCHANGDAAIDRYIEAISVAKAKYPDVENRPVLIHGQVLREDQVDPLKELGIFPSLFPMHTFYWGDWHRDSVLGPARAENISPTGWLLERDMMFGSHHDAPVALPDSMRVLSATVTRRTRSGDILGSIHRVPVWEALKSLTIWPAWQHFEE